MSVELNTACGVLSKIKKNMTTLNYFICSSCFAYHLSSPSTGTNNSRTYAAYYSSISVSNHTCSKRNRHDSIKNITDSMWNRQISIGIDKIPIGTGKILQGIGKIPIPTDQIAPIFDQLSIPAMAIWICT